MSVNSKMTAIADNIRSITGKTEKLNLDEIASSVNEVYEKGEESGKKVEYDKFWDAFQEYGKRPYYGYFVNNQSNVGAWFYPKYDIKPTDASFFMRETKFFSDGTTLDLVERLNECGVTIDFSNCANVGYSFFNARISRLPEINITKAENSGNSLLFGMYIETIDKFIFNENQTLNNTFGYCSALKNIVFEGVYKAGGLNMKWSTSLSKDSIISVINCLATDTSGLTVTLSKQAKDTAFGTSETIELNKITQHETWGNDLFYADDGVYFDKPTHISGSVTFKSMLDNLDYTCDFDISNVSENGNEIQINENLSVFIHYFMGSEGLHNFSAILVEPRYNGNYAGYVVGGSITIQATSNAQWQALVASKSNWTISLT